MVKKYKIVYFITIGIISIISSSAYSFYNGVGVHFNQNEGDVIPLLKKLNLNSFRTDFPWQLVEGKKNEYKLSGRLIKIDKVINDNYRDISPILILDYGNNNYLKGGYPTNNESINGYVDYASWVVNRYKGKVKVYEIWNEWNKGTGMANKGVVPSEKFYFELVKKTYKKIKSIDPSAKVIMGGMSTIKKSDITWFNNLVNLGVLNYTDGISVHNYNYHFPDKNDRNIDYIIDSIKIFENNIMIKYGKKYDIYITEIGYPSCIGADYCTSTKELRKKRDGLIKASENIDYIKGVWWYDLVDDGRNIFDKENNFGLFQYNHKEK